MDAGQSQLDPQNWNHAGYPGAANDRISDIIVVLGGLREEVEGVEAQIQKVESELLADPENKVLNRKFERLLEEKRNKEARRERLELQLAAPPAEHVYAAAPHGQGLLAQQPELQVHHPYYQLHHAGGKRARDEGQHEYPGMQGFLQHGMQEGVSPPQHGQQAPKGTGRGGKGGHKFCKRCKERITHGHQQKCKYCRKCYDENKELVLRAECPHGHDTALPASQQPMLLGSAPLEQHQAVLEAQQHQLQLQMQAAGQAGLAHLAPAALHLPHHMAMSHALPHASNTGQEPSQLQAEQTGHPAPAEMAGASEFQDSHSQQTAPPHLQPQPQARHRPSPVISDQPQQVSAGSAFDARSEEHERDKIENQLPAAGSPD